MSMEQILDVVRSLDGALVLAPEEGSEFPEIAWGDFFFYYAPDGQVPHNVQPYATIVTKDYPDDAQSELGAAGRWRVNIHVGRAKFQELTGESPRTLDSWDFAAVDAFMPHPVYGALGWVSVVNPGEETLSTVLELIRDAQTQERLRATRRSETHGSSDPPRPEQ